MSDDQTLRRRDFLARTAAAAGIGATAASALSPDLIIAEAAKKAARRAGLPNQADCPVEHVVVLMMENRSFDHYFGWLENADAIQQQVFTDSDGTEHATRHHSQLGIGDASWQGCGFSDPGHGWDSGRVQMEKGFIADGTGNDEFALSYFDQGELGFIHDAAKAYTIYDQFFCSLMCSTWPNRYYMWSAQSGGIKNNTPPVQTAGNQWETIFDRAIGKGLTARYYNSDLPFSAVWGARGASWTRPIAEYYADCALGTLPNVTFVDPPFRDGGGFDGNSADEHPHGDVRLGQAFMADVVRAFTESPCYRKGALFVVYDEWGGFFDHVTPPSVPDNRGSADTARDFGQMGFRIPALAISPWTRNGNGKSPARVKSSLYGFESILKFISWRWNLGTLEYSAGVPNLRHQEAANIGRSFDWKKKPDFEVPDLPDPAYVASRPCTIGGGAILQEDEQAHHDEMGELEVLADRFGIKVPESKPSDLFRAPDSVRKAVLANPS
jgi:phospholipase C